MSHDATEYICKLVVQVVRRHSCNVEDNSPGDAIIQVVATESINKICKQQASDVYVSLA